MLETVVAIVALLGLVLLVLGIRRLLRRRLISGSLEGLSGALLLALAALAFGVGLNLYTYQRLTHEAPVAEVEFQAVGPQHFRARLVPVHAEPRSFELRGDEWQLDARILKWQGPAVLLGLDTVYRLERLSGRYHTVAAERAEPRTVYALTDEAGVDVWALARRHERWLPWVDALYGSATYLPMADQARFAVTVSSTGLVTRPLNEAARQSLRSWR